MNFLRFDNSINFKLNIYTRINSIAFSEMCEIFGNKSEPSKEIKLIFSGKYSFDTYISNTGNDKNEISIVIATDTDKKTNAAFLKPLQGFTISMFAVVTDDGIFITKVIKAPGIVGNVSNRCVKCALTFDSTGNNGGTPLPEDICETVRQLAPIGASDISEDIAAWDEYLKIMERYAHFDECTVKYSSVENGKNQFSVVFYTEENKLNQHHINSSVMLVERCYEENGDTVFCGDMFGTITGFESDSITVLLDEPFKENFEFPRNGVLHITKHGDLVQIKRMRSGLKRFSNGRALNPYLDLFMFNSAKARVPNKFIDLSDEKLLMKNMNEEQRKAVCGALSSEDMFLIQGPPGTGKTTAIAEICYQNALMGKKTLIASQTNLAVDNALSRLASNPKIRALRRGNEKSVQREGLAFTEDNVISTWIERTTAACKENSEKYEKTIFELAELEKALEKPCTLHEKYINDTAERRDTALRNRLLEKLLNFGKRDCEELECDIEKFKENHDSAVIKRALMAELGDFKCSETAAELLNEKKKALEEALAKSNSAVTGVELVQNALKTVSACRESLDRAFEITRPKYSEFILNPAVLTKSGIMQLYAELSTQTDDLLKHIPGGFFRMFNLYGRWNRKAMPIYERLVCAEADLKLTLPVFKEEERFVFAKYSVDEKIEEAYSTLKEISDDYKAYIETLETEHNENIRKLKELSDLGEELFDALREFDKKIPEKFKRKTPEEAMHEENLREYYKSVWSTELYCAQSLKVLTQKWIKRINSGNREDYEELKRIYINNANVIGITCSGSGSSEFMQSYPEFDMVIIDEVSKATPPELILPALKAKTIVLVGDHKQLPPMIGSDTYEEISEELGDERLNRMKISLFESLYLNAPSDLKVMLRKQYRMHSQIMNTINQFYAEEGGLICGLDDACHEHGIEGGFIKKDVHAMWVYTPYESRFKEKRDDTSFYNDYEVLCIEKILEQLNENARRKGIKKEVGVITFYSGQTERLYGRISDRQFDNLDIRIGTVDKFQGVEKPVIICSFVRNNPMCDIGFAKDPRRINVALSRAQELLIIVGCSEMFCMADEKYAAVFNTIKEIGGDTDALDIV